MAVTAWGQTYIQATAPEEDPVQIGSLWIDTSGTATLKVCTAVSPYTFAEISGSGGTPDAHADSHENGGTDEIDVTGLSGVLADAQTAKYDTVITNTETGAKNDWAPTGLSRDTLILWNGASDIAPTGLAGGSAGQRVTFKNITSAKVATFAHASGSSSSGNKFTNIVTSAPTPVAAGGYITYQHDGSAWVIVAHEQGAWITAAFDANNYIADSGTWTVQSGDVAANAYKLSGTFLAVQWGINTTTVVGSPTYLRTLAAAYGGFTLPNTGGQFAPAYMYDNGNVAALITNNAVGSLSFTRLDGGTITASTNLTYVRGTFIGVVT